MKFMEYLRSDGADYSRVHDILNEAIDEWHDSGYNVSLQEFLGMSTEEYKIFVLNERAIIEYIKRERGIV